LHRAPLDGAQDTLAVLGGNIGGQLDLDLEGLLVAVFRVDDVVLRQANIVGRNVARAAVQLHEVRCAQRRRGQEVIEGTRSRTVTLVADGLVGHHGEVIKLRFEAKVVEKVDLDFHGAGTGADERRPPLSGFCAGSHALTARLEHRLSNGAPLAGGCPRYMRWFRPMSQKSISRRVASRKMRTSCSKRRGETSASSRFSHSTSAAVAAWKASLSYMVIHGS